MNHLRLNNYHFRIDRQPLAFPSHPRLQAPPHPRFQAPSHPRKQLRHTRASRLRHTRACKLRHTRACKLRHTRACRGYLAEHSTEPPPRPVAPARAGLHPTNESSPSQQLPLPRQSQPLAFPPHPRFQAPSYPHSPFRHTRARLSVIPARASSVTPAQTTPSYPRTQAPSYPRKQLRHTRACRGYLAEHSTEPPPRPVAPARAGPHPTNESSPSQQLPLPRQSPTAQQSARCSAQRRGYAPPSWKQ